VGTLYTQNSKRPRESRSQFAIFVEKIKIFHEHKLTLVVSMMGCRLVKILFLYLSSFEIMLHCELSSCVETVDEVAIGAVQAVEVGSKERRQPCF